MTSQKKPHDPNLPPPVDDVDFDDRTVVDLSSPAEAEVNQNIDEIVLSEATLIRKPMDEATVISRDFAPDLASPESGNAFDEFFDARTVVVARSKETTQISPPPAVAPPPVAQNVPNPKVEKAERAQQLNTANTKAKVPPAIPEPPGVGEHTSPTTKFDLSAKSSTAIQNNVRSETVKTSFQAPVDRLEEPVEGHEAFHEQDGNFDEMEEYDAGKVSLRDRFVTAYAIAKDRFLVFWHGLPPQRQKLAMGVGGGLVVAVAVMMALSGGSDSAEEAGDVAEAPVEQQHQQEFASEGVPAAAPASENAPPPVESVRTKGPEAVLSQFDEAFSRTQEQVYPKVR